MTKQKTILILAAILKIVFLNAQDKNFKNFISYFPDKQLPYVKNNFTIDTTKIIPNDLALKYLCKNDSTLLTFEVTGINQETFEVVYRETLPFNYKAYAKFQDRNYLLLVYDGYTDDGEHDFIKIVKLGLYTIKGQFLDEMLFYVFDGTGKTEEQTAQITNDFKIHIFKKRYIKDEKGEYTSSYYKITTTYEIDNISNKFKEINTKKELFDKSKK